MLDQDIASEKLTDTRLDLFNKVVKSSCANGTEPFVPVLGRVLKMLEISKLVQKKKTIVNRTTARCSFYLKSPVTRVLQSSKNQTTIELKFDS
jgi:hypothetical protein